MIILTNFFIGLVAFLHLYFFWLEAFVWTTKAPKIFRGVPKDLFPKTKDMMANQGLYNAFLAVGLIWSLLIKNPQWKLWVALFFLSCVVIAGIVGAKTVSKKIFVVQAVPAIIGLSLLGITTFLPMNDLPDPLEAGWKGEKVCEVLMEDDTVRVLKCTFPPGIGHEKHRHAPHVGYTLQGSTFQIIDDSGKREVEVPTGYDFSKSEYTIHKVLNVGDSTAVFLIIEPK